MANRSKVIWFTGLSGSGKTTLATTLKQQMEAQQKVYLLDGDILRNGINSDLGFSLEDRTENIRRAAHIAKLFLEEGYLVIASFITPLNSQQALARNILADYDFTEVYLSTPIEVCQQRDPKLLYQQSKTNLDIKMTGEKSPYEAPVTPNLTLDTADLSIEQSLQKITEYLLNQ